MGNPLTFPADSEDVLEQRWWGRIGQRFPSYAPFWGAFIGKKLKGGRLHPYGLLLPGAVGPEQSAVVLEAYDKLSLTHYSLFCELAGAHSDLDAAKASYTAANTAEKLFQFLESFNGLYDHLGTARNMAFGMWYEFSRMEETLAGHPPRDGRQRFHATEYIRFYLEKQANASAVAILNTINELVVPIRNKHVHDHVTFFVELNGRYHVRRAPSELGGPAPPAPFSAPHEDACDRMERHLQLTEQFVDGADSALQIELMSLLSRYHVNVDY